MTTTNIAPADWENLPVDAQVDLLAWRNIREPDAADLQSLANLYNAERFHSWRCPSCDEPVFEADPEDWSYFQGVCQNDRVSYPGKGPKDRRCDFCRCHNK